MNSSFVQWLLVQAFYCLHVATLTAYAIGTEGLQAKLNLNAAQMGSLSGAFFIAFGVSQLLIGSQLGRYPNRWMIGSSALMATLGSLLLLASSTYFEALAARVLMGAGAGNALVSTVRVVSERFPSRFPLMTNISQGLANLTGACLGLIAPLAPKLTSISFSYHWGFALLLTDTCLIFIFCKEGNQKENKPAHLAKFTLWPWHTQQVVNILRLRMFWTSMAFFAGLFGSFLSFAESWNIQFQIDVFHKDPLIAPLVNSAVIVGLAVGSIASGAIADRRGFQWPARVGAALTLTNLVILASADLPDVVAVICQLLLGVGMGTASLGLTCLRASVPKHDFSLASALMLTGVFLCAGFLTAAIGWSAVGLSVPNTGFLSYQRALGWLIAFAGMACSASLAMKPPSTIHSY